MEVRLEKVVMTIIDKFKLFSPDVDWILRNSKN